jgi:hypothetical protein
MFLKDFVMYTKWQSSQKRKKSNLAITIYEIPKKKTKQNPSIFLATTGTYNTNLVI